jgi:hypothetical protein
MWLESSHSLAEVLHGLREYLLYVKKVSNELSGAPICWSHLESLHGDAILQTLHRKLNKT